MTTPSPAALPDPGSELSRLTAAFLDGSLNLVDRDRLVALLRDSETRAAYRRIVWLHASLMRLWSQEMGFDWSPQPLDSGKDSAAAAPASRDHVGWSWPARWVAEVLGPRARRAAGFVAGGILAAVVVATVALLTTDLFGPARRLALVRQRLAGVIAEVVAVESPTWQTDAKAWTVWDGLLPGGVLDLASGRVEIALGGGTQIVVEGPAKFVVDGPTAVSLRHGKATVTVRGGTNASGDQSRFTLETPTATLTDIGTSFGVLVDQAGETSVTVFDGLVDLLPHTDGAVPLRLAAGEAGETSTQQPDRKAMPRGQEFVRTLGRPSAALRVVLAKYGWNEALAMPIYRDSFIANEPLAGSRPADRGGVGNAAWIAPPDGWRVDGSGSGLVAATDGTALLPFEPKPDQLYLFSVVIHATEDAAGFGGIGFTHWANQRHSVAFEANESFFGPAKANRVERPGRLSQSHVRTILLDTQGGRWRALFFVDDAMVGSHTYSSPPQISHLCLAVFPFARAEFRQVCLSSISHLPSQK